MYLNTTPEYVTVMRDVDAMKRLAAEAALDYIEIGDIVGVGTGSTANFFIDALARVKGRIDAAVASSDATETRLRKHGIKVLELNRTGDIPIYVDGADEATRNRHLIKGGGGALTREKIVAAASRRFACIVDQGKIVDVLGRFPLPVEVIPMAQSYVSRELAKLGGQPQLRYGFKTDNGNVVLDVRNLDLVDALSVEQRINSIAGVVANGIFACRPADTLIVGRSGTVETL